MALENVLEKLEAKIEELVGLYSKSQERGETLAARVAELEEELEKARTAKNSVAEEKQRLLEEQKQSMAERLEKTIALIDGVLAGHAEEAGE